MSITTGNVARCTRDHSIVTGNVETLSGDYCIVTGNVETLSGDYCIVTGDVRFLEGDHCTVTGNVEALGGDHNRITGNVEALGGDHNRITGNVYCATGDHNRISGKLTYDTGDYNQDKLGAALDGSGVNIVRGSGNVTIGVAPGPVTMTTSSDGSATTTTTRGPGWTTTRVVGSGGSVISTYNAPRLGGSAVFSGGNIRVAADGSVHGSVPGYIASQTATGGGRIHNVFGGSRPVQSRSSSSLVVDSAADQVIRLRRSGHVSVSSSSSAPGSRRRPSDAPAPPAKRVKAPVPPAVDDEPSAAPGEPLCVVCADRAVKTTNKPCGHACLCVTCARRLADEPKLVCPMCRAELKRIERLYLDTSNVAERGAAARGAAAPLNPPQGLAQEGPAPVAVSSSSSSSAPRLVLKTAAAPAADALLCVTVRSLAGMTYPVSLPASAVVAQLKERVYAQGGYPPAQQRLIYGDRALTNERTLAELGVPAGAEINMIGVLRDD